MRRTPVTSTDLRSVGYDHEVSILEVEFRSGGVYQYANVPRHIYEEMMKAESQGSYFNTQIRDRYSSAKI